MSDCDKETPEGRKQQVYIGSLLLNCNINWFYGRNSKVNKWIKANK